MEIEVGKSREIVLKKVFSGVLLVTDDDEKIGICMRDSGFEFSYGGFWYSAQKGVITKIDSSTTEGLKEVSENLKCDIFNKDSI